MQKIFILFFIFSSVLIFSKEKIDYLSLGAGINDFLKRNKTLEGRMEYKFYPSFLKFHPLLGFMATLKKATFTYGGVSLDLNLNKRVVFAPSFCAGYYTNGNGKDMGYPLEFKTGLEISLGLNNKGRVGIQVYHISNAKLGHKNPGTESLDLFYSFPIIRH